MNSTTTPLKINKINEIIDETSKTDDEYEMKIKEAINKLLKQQEEMERQMAMEKEEIKNREREGYHARKDSMNKLEEMLNIAEEMKEQDDLFYEHEILTNTLDNDAMIAKQLYLKKLKKNYIFVNKNKNQNKPDKLNKLNIGFVSDNKYKIVKNPNVSKMKVNFTYN